VLAAVGGQEDSRVSCINGDVTGGRHFVCAFDKAGRKRDLFPEKIIQNASVLNAVFKRISLHVAGKNCICVFCAGYYVDNFTVSP